MLVLVLALLSASLPCQHEHWRQLLLLPPLPCPSCCCCVLLVGLRLSLVRLLLLQCAPGAAQLCAH
jgi:hypothetical protein